MILRTALVLFAASSVALVACSSDDSPNDDQSSPDMGFSSSPPDTGVVDEPDAGFVDGGVEPCDPITGSGCVGGLTCAYVAAVGGVTVDEPQCRDLGAANPIGGACDALTLECIAGSACITEMDGPVCRKTCRPAMGNADCSGLPEQHVCVSLADGNGEFGWCIPVETCDPLDDMCPAGEVCGFVGQGELGCITAGTAVAGQSCQNERCARGSICINLGGTGAICYEPCDPNGLNTCPQTQSCTGLPNLDFGICQADIPPCDPVNDMCPVGDRCTLVGGQTECRAAGNVPRGGDCSTMSCQRGAVCVNVNNTGPICYQPCRAGVTVCETGMCLDQNLDGFDFSICFGG